MSKKPRVALYVRSAQKSPAIATDFHEAELRSYCEERDWPVVVIYKDRGKTRHLKSLMLDAARQAPRPFDAIVVKHVASISRRTAEVAVFMREVNDLGIKLAVVNS